MSLPLSTTELTSSNVSVAESHKRTTMEHFFTEFRDELYEDFEGQSILDVRRTYKGDTIFYEAILPVEQCNKGLGFSIWIKATIKEYQYPNQVWLNNVEVLRKFSTKEESDLEHAQANDIANRFKGDEPITLTKNGNWCMFPQSNKQSMTASFAMANYQAKYGNEALASALGFPQQIPPITKLLELIKLPPGFPLSRITQERESYPYSFFRRLIDFSEAEDVMTVLLRANINETDKRKEDTRSGEIINTPKIPQTEISEKDNERKDTGEWEGIDTPSAPLTEVQSDVVESVTIHEDVHPDKGVDKALSTPLSG